MGGQERARAAERSGEIWANTIGNLGQQIGGAVQQYGEQKERKKEEEGLRARDAAGIDFVANWNGEDPKELWTGLARIGGPEYAAKYGPMAQALKSKPTEDAKTELQGMYIALEGIKKMSPEMQGPAWEGFKGRYGPAAVRRLGVSEQILAGAWSPDHLPTIEAVTEPLGAVLGIKKDKATDATPKAGTFEDFVASKGAVTPEQKLVARQEWESAGRAPLKPEKTLAEIEAEAAARARGSASVKPAEGTEELTFNPEGVVLSSFGAKMKNEARRQATERGLPVFETAASQAKGVQLAGIISEAKELDELLKLPEVQASIGPVFGRLAGLQGAVMDLPPNVQRAMQLASSLSDTELRKRSGASITEPEFQRMLKFSTDPKKPLGHNITAVRGLLKAGARDYKALSGVDLSAPIAGNAAGAPVQIKNEADYNALPVGARFITPDGRLKQKGAR
jgi:hypothetical protein